MRRIEKGTNMSSKPEKENKAPNPLEQRLFDARIVTIFGEINMEGAQKIITRLFLLAAASDDPIKVIINSPGGHVEAGDTIHDVMQFIKPEIKVLGTGWVASAGSLIYLAAKKENRYSLSNTRYLLHQPHGGSQGFASDVKIQAKEIIKMKERLYKILAKATGQTYERIVKDCERDFWLPANEAKDYGIVGKVITSEKDFK